MAEVHSPPRSTLATFPIYHHGAIRNHQPATGRIGTQTQEPGITGNSCRDTVRCCWPTMAISFPFRDINVHSSPSQYAFSSPSNPSAPSLVVDRPSGDLRLHDGKLLGTQRVLGIAGI